MERGERIMEKKITLFIETDNKDLLEDIIGALDSNSIEVIAGFENDVEDDTKTIPEDSPVPQFNAHDALNVTLDAIKNQGKMEEEERAQFVLNHKDTINEIIRQIKEAAGNRKRFIQLDLRKIPGLGYNNAPRFRKYLEDLKFKASFTSQRESFNMGSLLLTFSVEWGFPNGSK